MGSWDGLKKEPSKKFRVCDLNLGANVVVRELKSQTMRDWLRTLIAGYGAYKLGGGCFGTIIVFILLFWLLGYVHC